jgi:hypothetical protein
VASFYTGTTTAAITVATNGNIGIGTTTPNHTLTVAGDVGAIAFVNTSTREAKTNISYLDATSTAAMFDQLTSLKIATYRYKIENKNDPLRLGFISEDAQTIAPEILSPDGKGVDLYKLATFTLAGVQTLAAKVSAQGLRLESLEDRIAKLESGSVSIASGSPLSVSTSSLADALSGFGVMLKSGIAQFQTLVARQFVASTDANGDSSAGSVTINEGNTYAEIHNGIVTSSTKIFLTFNSQVDGTWWVSDKANGSFRVTLSKAQTADVSFDYFLVQTKGQIATTTPSGASTTPSVIQGGGGSSITTPSPVIIVTPPPSTTSTQTATSTSSSGTATSTTTGTSTPPATASSTPDVSDTATTTDVTNGSQTSTTTSDVTSDGSTPTATPPTDDSSTSSSTSSSSTDSTSTGA